MAASGREARRRKIVERGSDRLALISGRVHNLTSGEYSPRSPSFPFNADSASSFSSPLSDRIASVSRGEVEGSDSPRKHDSVPVLYRSNANKTTSLASLHETEGKHEIPRIRTKVDEKVQSLRASSLDISKTKQQSTAQIQEPILFTASEISAAITASKITRVLCSVAGALLVVLSYLGFPLVGSRFMKSIIGFRPLYLVLMTNFTIVVLRFLSQKQRAVERFTRIQSKTSTRVGGQKQTSTHDGEEKQTSTQDGDDWTEHLSRALEIGFMMQKVMHALFRDCSVYASIVVCGLCLL